MKKIVDCLFIVSLVVFILFLSCKKENSCEGCINGNKPPIAVAGPDQVITLPNDSISLDGSASNDPDGKISEWLWTKISGPASFNVANAATPKTVVKNLVAGIYLFELKITDDQGLFATDTMQVTVNSTSPINRAPVANAGNDTTITLPANTVNLDGSRSTDPDNNITSYLWTKITGPSFFNIGNANGVQTQATNLVQGNYKFELRVTDAGGLFSRDTMQVTVNSQPPPLCDNSNRPIIYAQLIPVTTLPGKPWAVASVENKIAFICSGTMHILDLILNTWSMVDLHLSMHGYSASIAVIGSGNKIFFAGGEDGIQGYTVVDIYDVSTNMWTISNLSSEGTDLSVATCGNKVFFTGGNWGIHITSTVDIYDLTTNTWSTASLSAPRNFITAVSASNKAYFTGGDPWTGPISNIIDIYDNLTGNWSTSTMQIPRVYHAGVAVNDVLYFAGGNYPTTPTVCSVETLNMNTGDRTLMNLFGPAAWFIDDGQNAVVKDSKIIFLRLNGGADANRFDIYDTQSKSWSIGVLPQAIPSGAIAISVNNTIYIAGGYQNNQVLKLEF